jgi:hypothetical protein
MGYKGTNNLGRDEIMNMLDLERRGIPPELSWLERAFLATQRFANKDFEWRPPSGGEDEAQEDYIKRQLYEGYRGERVYGPRRPAPSVAQAPLAPLESYFDPRAAEKEAIRAQVERDNAKRQYFANQNTDHYNDGTLRWGSGGPLSLHTGANF